MKRTLTVISLVGLLGAVFLAPAYAGWSGERGCGAALGAGCGKGACLSREKNESLDSIRQEFRSQTQELRQELHGKKGLYRELMQQDDPSKEEAAKLWSEIFDLQLQLQQMRAAAGIAPGGNCGCDGGDLSENRNDPRFGRGSSGGCGKGCAGQP